MKVLFILENTIQNLEGGTEVSSWHLARLLRKKNIEVNEWTPYRRRKPTFFYTCILGQLYIFIRLLCDVAKIRPQILHIQGKYLLPSAVIVGKLLKIPTIATIRDYVVVCPIGLCLFETFRGQSFISGGLSSRHNFGWYITKEIPKFLSIYHLTESTFKKAIRAGLMIRGWFISKYLKWWLKGTDRVIAVSEATQRILKENGVESQVIYNVFDTELSAFYKDSPCGKESPFQTDKKRTILFVGKQSYGKGYDLFQSLSRNKLFKNYKFKIIGGVNKLGYLDTLKEIKQALTVVVPSRWPEPFGRVALESIAMEVPVLTTNRGGLPEIVEDGNFGYVRSPEIRLLILGLRKIIKNNVKLRRRIKKEARILTDKFRDNPLAMHLNLYHEII